MFERRPIFVCSNDLPGIFINAIVHIFIKVVVNRCSDSLLLHAYVINNDIMEIENDPLYHSAN